MFERLGKQLGNSRLDFLQTHPSSDTRVKVGAPQYLSAGRKLTACAPSPQLLEAALPQGYAILAANPECSHVRDQIEAFKATARAIKPGEDGNWEFA